MIKPSVGRVVLYVPESLECHVGFTPGAEHAAIVTAVHSDRLINVAAFNPAGVSYSRTSVQLLQDDDQPHGSCHCKWMEYQKGQAAKTEDLEKKLAAKS